MSPPRPVIVETLLKLSFNLGTADRRRIRIAVTFNEFQQVSQWVAATEGEWRGCFDGLFLVVDDPNRKPSSVPTSVTPIGAAHA